MDFDPLFLSRLQFAFTIGFHILFPTFTMGLALFLIYVEGQWLRTRDLFFLDSAKFWSKLFALSFGTGVVSGVVLSYEIGTNFGEFSRITGNVLGPIMSYEVLTAFFLEAGFLGIMLFGWNRVGPRLHYFATVMVGLGTFLSAFWILSANSWMHTPDGFRFEDGQFFIASWWDAVFNPSFPYRLAHMLNASYLTTTFVVAGIAAWYLQRGRDQEFARRTFKAAVLTAALLAPTQILIGDLHGLNTLEHQPVKVAAMEGHWETGKAVPFLVFAWPDQEAAENHLELGIPYAGSLILTHSLNGEVAGLTSVPADGRPYVPLVFFSFRLMLALGTLMLGLAWYGAWRILKHNGEFSPWYLRAMTWASPIGFIAVIAGWVTTEVGRQPWTVHGLLRTADSGSPSLTGAEVALSLSLFVVVYTALFGAFMWFLLFMIRKGPKGEIPRMGEERADSRSPAIYG
ncbi:MAG: cytochrome ubiquinol oxidase subunit I [Gammaproteobacteria bacterium]